MKSLLLLLLLHIVHNDCIIMIRVTPKIVSECYFSQTLYLHPVITLYFMTIMKSKTLGVISRRKLSGAAYVRGSVEV